MLTLDRTVYLALFAALVNVMLSHVVPCAVSSRNRGLVKEIRDEFSRNKGSMMISSIVVGIIVWVALNYEREFRETLPRGLINFSA